MLRFETSGLPPSYCEPWTPTKMHCKAGPSHKLWQQPRRTKPRHCSCCCRHQQAVHARSCCSRQRQSSPSGCSSPQGHCSLKHHPHSGSKPPIDTLPSTPTSLCGWMVRNHPLTGETAFVLLNVCYGEICMSKPLFPLPADSASSSGSIAL